MWSVIEMAKLSPTMEQGMIVSWCKREGDEIEKGEILYEVETDKANVEVESPRRGYLRKVLVGVNVPVPVNTPIAVIADSMEEDISGAMVEAKEKEKIVEESKEKPLPVQIEIASKPGLDGRIKISPIAMRIAKEHGIDPAILRGTGPGGRIIKEDIEKAISERQKSLSPPSAQANGFTPTPTVLYKDIQLTKMRKVIAQRLSESKRVSPHFYIGMFVDATNINRLITDLEKKVEQLTGLKLTLTDLLVKLVGEALKEFPIVNASFLDDRIRVYQEINIGVAVGFEEGLLVPVIRNVDQKTISQICQELKELGNKVYNKKLLPQEYSGGTFTLTNLGMFGVETFHAIINPPESAILAVGSIKQSAVVIDGRIESRPVMNLSLSVDHRILDGIMAARFLGRVKELIESPYLHFVLKGALP